MTLVWLGLVAAVLGGFYAGVELSQSEWDAAGVISFGEEEPERVDYAFRVFDREIPLTEELGHDGRFFFIQAMDPFFLDAGTHASFLDRPTYRGQRMLYPTLASLGGLFGPESTAWMMIGLNVVFFVAGTVLTGRLAQLYGLTAWAGLAFALNPGVRFELDIDGAGVLAMASLMASLVAVRAGKLRGAIVALVFAALAREVMLVGAIGIALSREISGRRDRLLLVAVPSVVAGGWWAYVRLRLGDLTTVPAVEEIGVPFNGFFNALERWLEAPGTDLALGLVYLVASLLLIFRASISRALVPMAGAGFAAVGLVLSEQVWYRHFNISRALSPIVTLYVLAVLISMVKGSEGTASDASV